MVKRVGLLILIVIILSSVFIFATKLDILRSQNESVIAKRYEVAPRFREFYFDKGGERVLGYIISPLFYDNDGNEYQYTTNVLMVYKPSEEEGSRFGFGAIGWDLGVANQLLMSSETEKSLTIYPAFEHLYEELGGTDFVGKPLSPPLFDFENKRVVQYFENLGFYMDESRETDNVGLLYYGLWKCAKACGGIDVPNNMALIDISVSRNYSLERYAQTLTKDITGEKLSEPIANDRGEIVVFYENLALFLQLDDPQSVNIMPLPLLLGIQRDMPERKSRLHLSEDYIFFSREGDIGYEIYKPLLQYFSNYGGVAFTGAPITHPQKLSGVDRYRQCFENICVTYAAESEPEVNLEPLGYTYFTKYFNSDQEVFLPLVMLNANNDGIALLKGDSGEEREGSREYQLYSWPSFILVRSDQRQILGFSLSKNGQPQDGIHLRLSVWLPDGRVDEILLNPTNRDGRTFYKLDPILAPNGTRIIYEACVDDDEFEQEDVCSKGDFIIWGN